MAIRRTYSSKTPSLAILDDYLNTSSSHFAKIPPSQLRTTTFNDIIAPSDEVDSARLVERLQPFELMSTVRKRTTFPGSLLRQLHNLKLLLATNTQFEMFDLASARQLGIKVVAAPGLGRTNQAGPVCPNIKKGSVHPTTQHACALILALALNAVADDALLNDALLKAGSGS
ncbi:unnamed protein product, partial [Clonostachys solani]